MELQVKVIETKSRDQLKLARKLYLILNIRCRHIRFDPVICVGCTLSKTDRRAHRRVRVRNKNRRGTVIEVSRVAEITRVLPSEFRPPKQRVTDAGCRAKPGDIRLVE